MLKGINDSEADARELIRLIAGMPAKVNLIPFNPWPGSPYETSTAQAIERFAKIVNGRRLFLAGARAARARYPGGLRAIAHREPAGSAAA